MTAKIVSQPPPKWVPRMPPGIPRFCVPASRRTKPLNNLDVYGNKSTYNMSSSTSPNSAFNVSQRLGDVSQITYNTDIYKPIYNVSQYARTKPFYEVPDNLIVQTGLQHLRLSHDQGC